MLAPQLHSSHRQDTSIMKPILYLTLLFLSPFILAAEPKWEYFTTSSFAAASEVKEPELKAWLKDHRPQAYEKYFGEKKKEADAKSKETDLTSSLMELAQAVSDPQIIAVDYYINAKAREGWELFSAGDKLLIFRREPQKVK
jgi:hypothetical protein